MGEAVISLAGNGQSSKFINEIFSSANTDDFEGSVHCTAPAGMMFTGVALEMDFKQPDLHHPPGGPGPVTVLSGPKPKRGNRTSGCPFFLFGSGDFPAAEQERRLSCRRLGGVRGDDLVPPPLLLLQHGPGDKKVACPKWAAR